MAIQTSLLHFLNASFLHDVFMFLHEFRHLLFVSIVCLSICGFIIQFHVNHVGLKLSRLHCRISTPILVSFTVGSCPYEAWVVCLKHVILLLLVLLWKHLEGSELRLMRGREVPRYVVGNLKT